MTLDGVRIHLRTDEGKLWVNGYYSLFLNKTATTILSNFIDCCKTFPRERVVSETVKRTTKQFRVEKEKARKDLEQLIGIINSLARNEIPTHLIGVKQITSQSNAPDRMDISLTYDCDNNCSFCYLHKNKDESGTLTTQQWKEVLTKLWSIGVPQVVFTGGECTLRKDLVELVEFGKEFTTGIITNGTLITKPLAKALKKADLDWIQITLESDQADIHDAMQGRKGAFLQTIKGIKNCVGAGLIVSINSTLTKKNYKDLPGLMALAKKLGVMTVSSNAIINAGRGIKEKNLSGLSEEELRRILINAKKTAGSLGISYNWFLPTCYKKLNPVELGFGERSCSACGVNMMIEPNGDVIPCQSWTDLKLGNILKDDWNSIWNGKEAQKIRDSGFAIEKCRTCEFFDKCGGGCPLNKINGCYLKRV